MKKELAYKRILLKLSGEALVGDQNVGIDPKAIHRIGKNVQELIALGVEVAIVIGGGNFLRGTTYSKNGFDRITCDEMGMLATVMNGLALQDSFINIDIPTHVMSPFSIEGMVENFNRLLAMSYLESGKAIIFVGGTGSPLVTTDSAASLRGIEINADIILKATKVDGIYSSDPVLNPKAKLFKQLTYAEAIEKELGVMDLSALSMCRDHNMLLRVFNMNKPNVLKNIVMGGDEGTLVSN